MKPTYTQLLQLTCFLCIFFTQQSWSQIKLGDKPKAISPYALLELESTTKGLIIPQMTSAQRDNAFDQDTPVGTLIYNTEDDQLQYFSERLDPKSKSLVKVWQPASNVVPSSSNTSSATLVETAQDGNMFYDATTNTLYTYNTLEAGWIPVGGNINEVPENRFSSKWTGRSLPKWFHKWGSGVWEVCFLLEARQCSACRWWCTLV